MRSDEEFWYMHEEFHRAWRQVKRDTETFGTDMWIYFYGSDGAREYYEENSFPSADDIKPLMQPKKNWRLN